MTFPLFHDGASQLLMWGPSCSPTKHILDAPGKAMELTTFHTNHGNFQHSLYFLKCIPLKKRWRKHRISWAQRPMAYGSEEERDESYWKSCSQDISPHHYFPFWRLLHDGVGFPSQVFYNFFLSLGSSNIKCWLIKYTRDSCWKIRAFHKVLTTGYLFNYLVNGIFFLELFYSNFCLAYTLHFYQRSWWDSDWNTSLSLLHNNSCLLLLHLHPLDALQPSWEENQWYHCGGGNLCVYKYNPLTGKSLYVLKLSCADMHWLQDTVGEQDGCTSQCTNSELWIHFSLGAAEQDLHLNDLFLSQFLLHLKDFFISFFILLSAVLKMCSPVSLKLIVSTLFVLSSTVLKVSRCYFWSLQFKLLLILYGYYI